MTVVLLTGYGDPNQLVYREDVSVPKIEPKEVLIKVGACGMNNTDIWMREGVYGREGDPNAVSAWRQEPM